MLKWTEETKSNKECAYTHVISETPLGQLRIEWKGWKDPAARNFDITLPWKGEEYISYLGHDLESSKEAVQKLWDDVVVKAMMLTSPATMVRCDHCNQVLLGLHREDCSTLVKWNRNNLL